MDADVWNAEGCQLRCPCLSVVPRVDRLACSGEHEARDRARGAPVLAQRGKPADPTGL